ncbi:hypothetical protein BJ508DRAFT_418891 [Ascobolus immersus RN42]|uniref:Uncharacterized protein n=1 Tax=Ascobolus immersus RN42 TaxID=1160509 RepID=A0A3N4HIP4_ASCIM|nr:hypothetical protein BJ508DRAFT_418891 [Ascobolus immersus RN42]
MTAVATPTPAIAPAPGLFYVGPEPFPRQCICGMNAKTAPPGTPHIVSRKEDWVFHALRTRLDSIPDEKARAEEQERMKLIFKASKEAKKAAETAQVATTRGGFNPNDNSGPGYVAPSIINLAPAPHSVPIGVLPSPPATASQWGGYPGIHQASTPAQSPGYPQQHYYPPPPPGGPPQQQNAQYPPPPPQQFNTAYNPQPYNPQQYTQPGGLYSPPYTPQPVQSPGSAADFYSSPTQTPTYTPTSPPAGSQGHGPLAASDSGSTDRGLFSKARPSSISSLSSLFKSSSGSGGDKEKSSDGMGKLLFKGLKLGKKVYSHSSGHSSGGGHGGGHGEGAAASEDQAAAGGGEEAAAEDGGWFSGLSGGEEAYVDPGAALEGVAAEEGSGFWDFLGSMMEE